MVMEVIELLEDRIAISLNGWTPRNYLRSYFGVFAHVNSALYGKTMANVTFIIFDNARNMISMTKDGEYLSRVADLSEETNDYLEDLGILILLLNVCAIIFIEYAWDAYYLCGTELMSANVRSSALESCSMMARCGAILSPMLPFLNTFWPEAAYGTGILILLLNVCAIIFIEYAWDACYLCGTELMSTNVRSSALESCSMMARCGAILSPMLPFLNTFWPEAAYGTVTIVGFINLTISYLYLTETKNVILDTVTLIKELSDEENVRMSLIKD
uniref:MFS domain-containing protein n=1 Tax=Rhabditophanes sp. KR3021 TaxID=114890 RepID=A0AC35TYW5_9BILA